MSRKTAFFEGCSCFKFNNLGLTLGTNLKFYTSVAKGLKLKVRKFLGLIPTFVEVTGEKLVGGGGAFLPPPLHPSWIGLRVDYHLNRIWSSWIFFLYSPTLPPFIVLIRYLTSFQIFLYFVNASLFLSVKAKKVKHLFPLLSSMYLSTSPIQRIYSINIFKITNTFHCDVSDIINNNVFVWFFVCFW